MQSPFQCCAHGQFRLERQPRVVCEQQAHLPGTSLACKRYVLPTHDVDCPECGKFLYTALSLEDLFPADAATSPRVLTDAQGDYLPCPHCKARVAMQRVLTNAGAVYRIVKSR